ncbi:MAG: hypothetical protein GY835_13715 [bacterium]|nr:hypothetical protein [bacterium]
MSENDPWSVFDFNYSPGRGGAICAINEDTAPEFLRCTFDGNWSENYKGECGGGSICSFYGANLVLDQVIITGTTEGGGIFTEHSGSIDISCSDVWSNQEGNYLGTLGDQTGINGNISQDPLFCNFADGVFSLYDDSPCLPAGNDCNLQMGAFGQGCVSSSIPGETPAARFALGQNHPNPFNPATEISFSLHEDSEVRLVIYDVGGRHIRSLIDGEKCPAGDHARSWDGTDAAGNRVSSGIYFYRLEADSRYLTRKMVMLK